MQIRDMFLKNIDRDLQGVIIVGQDENANVKQELEEYVVTRELQKHFADFFSAYKQGIIGNTTKTGVWISGFFGSGKSHLLKILSYLLENKEIAGKHAIDYFIDDHKIQDASVLADMQLAAQTPTDVVLFNIDSKSESNGKENKDAIVNVFLKVFNEMQGFCGSIPYLADLEKQLSDKGRYEEFKEKFEEAYGDSWENSRNDFDFIQDDIVDVLSDMGFMSEDAARNWCEKASGTYQISIEDFAKRVKKYIDSKGNNHHVVFAVDEVGQYIGDNRALMLNLQTLEEDLGRECMGKAWIIVTSQQDIDSVVKVIGNDFSKIQGRFDTRLSLSSANVDAVIKKRILEKKDTAAQMLRLLYGQKQTIIENRIVFSGSVERKLYSSAQDFADVYPFIPYQFNLLASVLTAIRTHGASGKHLSEGERSMLAMFKESAAAWGGMPEGTLIPFYAFYAPMENFLDHSHRSVIIKAYDNGKINPEHKDGDVFAINVLKTLFLIKYVEDIQANIDNITTLMMTSIDEDRITLKERVQDALTVLQRQMLVQKNGDVYVFLTDEEQEINREIEEEQVDNAEVINKISEMIFDDILKDNRYQYPKFNGRYAFRFNQTVDDRPYKANQNNDIGVHIITPAADIEDEITLRMMSGQGKEVLVVLPNDRSFMDEIQTYLKIEKFLRRNTTSALTKYESIKDAKRLEMRDRSSNAKVYLTEALKESAIYVNGDKANIKAKDVSSRINEAVGRLVDTVYHKLSYIDAAFSESDIRKLFDTSSQMSLKLGDQVEANVHALDDVLQYIQRQTQMHMKTSMKTVKDYFMKAPYGFVEDDVDWLIAKLFRRGDLTFYMNGAQISLINKTKDEIISYITKKQYQEKLMMEQRTRISDREKKICRDVMKELFHVSTDFDDEDQMMQAFIRNAQNMANDLDRLLVQYDYAKYPGKKTVSDGKRLLTMISQAESTTEFYKNIQRYQDDFLDFADYYEPIRSFFKGEQKQIFDRAIRLMNIYEDSKTYIADEKLEENVHTIENILNQQEPYNNIPKLPELLETFMNLYNAILDTQEAPVLTAIRDAEKRVIEVLSTKPYKAEKEAKYHQYFSDLYDQAQHCNNVSSLRSFADKADAQKIRLLNEMDKIDQELERKRIEEEQRRAREKAEKEGKDIPPVQVVPVHQIKTKNVTIKDITGMGSLRVKSQADIDAFVADLKKQLEQQLEDDTIVNIEF
jgi:energy-coupling factor transporter ATP-binding protein EcfA2